MLSSQGGGGGGIGSVDLDDASAPTEEAGAGAWARVGDAASMQQMTMGRPPLGAGVRADPASHQHKRPVSEAKHCVCRIRYY